MNPEISVIIAVYNTEKYLENSVNSILSQDFTSFEIILIDDGSTDTSGAICDRIALKDNRVKVFHQKNSGPSAARNYGIEKAAGKYIFFLDSDDYIANGYFKTAYDAITVNNADIVIFGYFLVVEMGGKETLRRKITEKSQLYSSKTQIGEKLIDWKKNVLIDPLWNKLYSAELITSSGVLMPEGELFEDTDFNIRLLECAKNVYFSENCYYDYIQRTEKKSITKRYIPNKLDFLKKRHIVLTDLLKNTDCYNEKAERQCNYFYIKHDFSAFIDLFFSDSKLNRQGRKEFIKKEIQSLEFKEAVKNIHSDGKFDSIVILIAKSKNVSLIYFFCKMIYLIKFKMHGLFTVIKNR